MNKLSPVPYTFQKTPIAPIKQPYHQPKKYDAPPAKKFDAPEPKKYDAPEPKKNDAPAAKNDRPEKIDQPDDKNLVDRKFSDLISEQKTNETAAPIEIQTQTAGIANKQASTDATPIDAAPANADISIDALTPAGTTILASELADSKLAELNLNQTGAEPTVVEPPVAAQAVVSQAVIEQANVSQADVETDDIAPQIAVTVPKPLTPENTSNDNVELVAVKDTIVNQDVIANKEVTVNLDEIVNKAAATNQDTTVNLGATANQTATIDKAATANQQATVDQIASANQDPIAKNSAKQPLTTEINPQSLAENLENPSTENLGKMGLTPEQAAKTLGQAKNPLAAANDGNVNPKAEKTLAELGASLGQTQNQLGKNSSELAATKPSKPPAAVVDQEAVKTEFNGDKAIDMAQQNAANQTPKQIDKYAERYSQNQNAEQSLSGDADKSTSAAHNQLTAAYNNAKSNISDGQNANGSMSALDKIADKNPSDFLNQLQNDNTNQQIELNNQDKAANVRLSMQNGKLTQNLPLNSMAFQIGKQFSKGNSEFQIRLDPAELGRVNIKLTVKQGGDIKAHMVTERNDVFELLQRDSRALEKALNDAGFDGNNIEVEVTLDQNAQNGGTFAENFFDKTTDNDQVSNANADNDNETEQQAVKMVASHMPLHVTSTAVDRKI
ncbi:MAG: flagellar hook-length control protein FliK [Alphaproteobacteria bacterium]|nr:flagellar hook-length control protein FliK [Alphaproteobacteria bacterium]